MSGHKSVRHTELGTSSASQKGHQARQRKINEGRQREREKEGEREGGEKERERERKRGLRRRKSWRAGE